MSWYKKIGQALKPVAKDAGDAAVASLKLSALAGVKPVLEQAIIDKMQLAKADAQLVDDVIYTLQHLKAIQRKA